jgi:serine/threonine protein kinase
MYSANDRLAGLKGHLTPEAWNDVRAIVDAALLRDPEERASFVDAACAARPDLRAQVVALLSTWNDASERFEKTSPAFHTTATPEGGNSMLVGRKIGPYIVRDELGRGGMGVVYLADDTRLGRRVALKALHPHVAAGAEQRERLRQEARIAAALSHSGIATVYALEEFEGVMYVASEFVPGRTIRAVLQEGPLSLPLLLDVATQIARVLAAAHALGIVHRDLKPDNVMLTPTGVVKLLDFGLAKSEGAQPVPLTRAGTVVGTPAYMAPEQLLGERADFRADLFALGVVVYEMASGGNPFEAATMAATIDRVLRHEPPPLSTVSKVPAALEIVVQTCLRKRPSERYRSTELIAGELERVARPLETHRESHGRTGPAPRPARQSRAGGGSSIRSRDVNSLHRNDVSGWRAGALLPRPWGTAFHVLPLTCATAATILRLNLRFTSRVYPAELSTQIRRVVHRGYGSPMPASRRLCSSAVSRSARRTPRGVRPRRRVNQHRCRVRNHRADDHTRRVSAAFEQRPHRLVTTVRPRQVMQSPPRFDARLTAAFACAAGVGAQFVAGKATRDALYLANLDITTLPSMVIATAVVSLLLVAVLSKALSRRAPEIVIPVIFVANAVLLLAEWRLTTLAPVWAARAVYLQIAGVGPMLGSGFWLM